MSYDGDFVFMNLYRIYYWTQKRRRQTCRDPVGKRYFPRTLPQRTTVPRNKNTTLLVSTPKIFSEHHPRQILDFLLGFGREDGRENGTEGCRGSRGRRSGGPPHCEWTHMLVHELHQDKPPLSEQRLSREYSEKKRNG